MSVRRIRLPKGLVLLLTAALAVTSCSGVDGGAGGVPHEPWAHEAEELFEAMAAELSEAEPYTAATYYATEGLLDLRAWGGEVYAGSEGIGDALGSILFIHQRRADVVRSDWSLLRFPRLVVDVDQIFVGSGSAVVRFDGHVHAGVPWAQLFSIGHGTVITSRLYTEDLGHLDPAMRWVHAIDHPFYDEYVDAWRSGDASRIGELYAATTTVVDELSGTRWTTGGDLDDLYADAELLAPGPWPELFRFDVGERHEQIAVFQVEEPCPRLEARRWVFEDDVIVHESRYTHLPSARRCGDTEVDGWWTGLDIEELDRERTGTIEVGGEAVVVVNASERQLELVGWLFGRYAAAGLGLPEIAAFAFPPSIDCDLAEGIAERDDVRFDGRHSVTLCFDDDQLSGRAPGRAWSPHVAHQGLHELAHVWMYDHLSDSDRQAFLDRVALDEWRGADVFWPERGVEVAAETIAWGLAGDRLVEYAIDPVPACAELAARFRLLTDRPPLTSCAGDGDG